MRTLIVEPTVGRPAGDRPLDVAGLTVVSVPTLVVDPNGQPLAALLRSGPALAPVVAALAASVRRLGTHSLTRPGGLTSNSRTFGFSARMPARGFDSCRACLSAVDHPAEHAVLAGAAARFLPALRSVAALAPVVADLENSAAEILPAWRLPGAPWTSGIVNHSSALTWHRDRNNTPDAWQLLVTFRRHMAGGLTVVPELGVAFAAGDGDVVTFPGQRWWHGVTPLHPTRTGAYRHSVVYYQIGAMKACLPPDEERARAGRVRSGREALWAGVESGDPEAIAAAAAGLGLEVAEFLALRQGAGE